MQVAELGEPRGQACARRLRDVLKQQQLGEHRDGRRRNGEQRHEQEAPGARPALFADRSRYAASHEQARQRRGSKRKAKKHHREVELAERAEGLEQPLAHGLRCFAGLKGRGIFGLDRREPCSDLRFLQSGEQRAEGELRHGHVGEQHRYDDQRHGQADHADDELGASGPGERPHPAGDGRRGDQCDE